MIAASNGSAEILTAIYDAVLEPSRWDEVVGRIVAATNSVSGSIAIRRSGSIHLSAIHNMDPFYLDLYAKNFYNRNPLDTLKDSLSPGQIRSYTKVTQSRTFKSSAYFNEFIHPQGWGDGVISCLARGQTASGYFGIIRSPDRMLVEPAEWNLLETVVPHLQRAVEVQRLLLRATTIADSLGQAFTAAGFGVLLVSGDCGVLFGNAKAEEHIRRRVGLGYARGRLVATDRVVNQRLQALVRAGTKTEHGTEGGGGTLELRREGEGQRLIVHVIPLVPQRTWAILDRDRPAAAVFVVDPGADLLVRVRQFAARFGLTSAEIRVLAEIIAGSRMHAAADKLKIAEGTVRTHAKRILAKTGTTRQSELIRRFFETSLPGSSGFW